MRINGRWYLVYRKAHERSHKNTTILFNSGYKEEALALGQSILMINPEYIMTNSSHGPGIGPDITLILGLDYISLDSHKLFAQDESFQPK